MATGHWVCSIPFFLFCVKQLSLNLWLASLLFYISVALISKLCCALFKRYAMRRLIPYIKDFWTSFHVLGWSLENINVRCEYGDMAYFLTIVVLGIVIFHIVTGGVANPGRYIIGYIQGELPLTKVFIRVAVQMAGALLSYRYAMWYWSLELHMIHTTRAAMTECDTDLTVHYLLGFLIEFFGMVCDCLVWFTPMFLSVPVLGVYVKLFLGCVLTMLGVDYTGMYMNPVNATNQTFGCRGARLWQFVFVYWFGPLLGVMAAYAVHHRFKDLFKPRPNEIFDLTRRPWGPNREDLTASFMRLNHPDNNNNNKRKYYPRHHSNQTESQVTRRVGSTKFVGDTSGGRRAGGVNRSRIHGDRALRNKKDV